LVICLCAQWCSTCRSYRATFERAAREFADARFLWVDIEDEAEVMGAIDVENFPTLLIGTGGDPRFFGTLTPQPEILARLLRAHLGAADAPALGDAEVAALLARCAALPQEDA
jgi:thiol-disulfide isomerase/thioredoxin